MSVPVIVAAYLVPERQGFNRKERKEHKEAFSSDFPNCCESAILFILLILSKTLGWGIKFSKIRG
jgi:hypothetical protein